MNQKIKTLLLLICVLSIWTAMNIILFRHYLDAAIQLETTYIAKHEIAPRTEITADDLVEIKIPKRYMQTYTWNDISDIVGKYTSIQGQIPAGSPFYKNMIFTADELRDLPVIKLYEENTIFTMEISLSSLGSVTEGMYVDIFVSISQREQAPISDMLIKHAEVISIKDHKGISIDEDSYSGIPYFIELGIRRTDIALLTMAVSLGEIRLFPSEDPYRFAAPAPAENSRIIDFLNGILE